MVEGVNVTHPVPGMAAVGSKASEAVRARVAGDGACAQADVAGLGSAAAGAGDLAVSSDDRQMLLELLAYVGDHGGGSSRWPDCNRDTCPSCQANHLHARLSRATSEAIEAGTDRVLAAMQALGREELVDGQESLAGVIAGTQAATEACIGGDQLRTAELWAALGQMATAIRDDLITAASEATA